MIIRLGYVAIALNLKNVTSSSTVTFATYNKLKNEEERLKKLKSVTFSNTDDLETILKYNMENNIHFYRLTSKLIPLSTHPEVIWEYEKYFSKELKRIGDIIKKSHMRVDFHPSEYCVLNSTKKEVVEQSIDILKYHYNLLCYLKVENPLLVLHIGSKEFGKEKSLTRFVNNFKKLPKNIQKVIAIENDDKSFNIEDCINLSKKIDIPIILDYHHHICNPSRQNIKELLPQILKTWKTTPKMHFSSPKSKLKKEYCSHNEYINIDEFMLLLNLIKKEQVDIDIMIEAKKKDEALFRLVRELKYKSDVIFLDETTFVV